MENTILPNGFSYKGRDYRYYIVTHFFDDSNGSNELYYVVRYFGKRRQYWHYEVKDEDDVTYEIERYDKK